MIEEAELRELIREYCHTELNKAKEWAYKNIQEFRKTLSEIKNTGNYELLRDALRYLYSGETVLKLHIKTSSDLENIWEKFLREVVETPPEELLKNIDERFKKWKKIRGAGKGLISESLAFYYPDYFVPWNNTVDWYFRELGWGRPTKYSEVLSRLRELKRLFKEECVNQDINFVLVDHFGWWLRNRRDNSSNGRTHVYLEITKPPGKPHEENHVGRLLWSPADEKYWNGRYGKMGLLNVGDIILHDVRREIIGYSVVAEPPKELTKEEVMELFEKTGIWDEEYKEFAEKWFKKSQNGKFYVVKLGDFKKLEKPVRYADVEGLPASSKLQGVYLIDISPKVLYNLGIVSKSVDTTVTKLGEYLASKGYLYPSYLVAQFYTALKTKGFVILSGLTGTGKTKIAQELAELLDDSGKNFLFLSVRPDWRDSKALLGYYNWLNQKYYRTELLEFILEAKKDYEQKRRNARPYFVLLDEMNLAHVEYYFADFLSVLESGRDEEGFTREPLRLHDVDEVEKWGIPKEIYLPPNLYIIGTVNMDETTYAFSPKVLDRAFVVEFHDVDLEEYPPEPYEPTSEAIESLKQTVLQDLKGPNGEFLARSKDELNEAVREFKGKHSDYWDTLVTLNKALEPYDMHFGYRVVDEIALFFKIAKESKEKGIVEFENDDEIFDLAILMKVLPKFHGNRKKLEDPLKEALKLCLAKDSKLNVDELKSADIVKILGDWENQKTNFRFKHTARKVLRMLRQLHEIGFASFS
ncbi:McrB family protein [Thermococcus waiotapuensis]|uniref:AAA family ATPase n=1 Tax=Thermococcus waiotapuensis TaxID=90909 RepID=A0AAE4NVU3_9EURY|nr:AAA family ATPase [Thermococcus waiotapuensis]MDV3104074.1 AAA family ATPase [Thermococcus waiotapuensis]